MAVFPSIPVPTKDPQALLDAVLNLKQAVEALTGQDHSNTYAVHTFVQDDMPDALHPGDLWLCTIRDNSSFNVWNGTKWLKVGTVMALSADGSTDFLLHKFARRP